MALTVFLSQLVSIVMFLVYGAACFWSQDLVREFKRYNQEGKRELVGALEIVGAVGQIAGFFYPVISIISSCGLALLMVFAVRIRYQIRDPFWHWTPAVLLFALNLLPLLYYAELI